MDRFVIQGPNRLEGSISAAGAKNASLPALAATLLADETVELGRMPQVQDIRTMLQLLEHLGLGVEEVPTGEEGWRWRVHPGRSIDPDAPYELVKRMRASVLVLGPLLARCGRASASLPGGCAIGVRPIDQHLAAFEALGAEVELEHGVVTVRCDRLQGARHRFTVPTVTGTENAMMAAVRAQGTTVLENCAGEPEVGDLAKLLNAMGARIEGAGTETIEIEGVEAMHAAKHDVIPDRIEVGTYLVGAALTGGSVEVERGRAADLSALLERLDECGCDVSETERGIRVTRDGDLAPRDVVTSPHPGFPTDLQAQYMALMTAARGTATICETVFENRFQHVPELNRMGADIRVDGRYARVHGPTELSGANVMATDLRASACLVLAGLVAHGETLVDRIYHLDRGYEGMERKLAGLGARVERVSVPWV